MVAVSCMERTLKLVRVLIDAGANVRAITKERYTALHMMIDVNGPTGSGRVPGQVARMLLKAGADTEVRQHWGWTPLMRAVVEGTSDEVRAIVDIGGKVNTRFPRHTKPAYLRGRTVLMAAIGAPAKVAILIDLGVDLTADDAYGKTALAYAQECLAEAESWGPSSHRIPRETADAVRADLVKHIGEMGIDTRPAHECDRKDPTGSKSSILQERCTSRLL